jgi:hypothetical protein
MMSVARFLASLSLISGLWAQPAQAALVLDLNSGGTPTECGGACASPGQTLGWAFSVLNTITLDGLGVWDAGANGLGVQSVQIGLWEYSSGTLLASATASDASTRTASASINGEWLFEDIERLTLGPGLYAIGMVFQSGAPTAQVGATYTTISDVQFNVGLQAPTTNGLDFPRWTFSTPVFGPNMRLATVPEPHSLGLLAIGLVGLVASGRRHRRS